MIYFLLKRALPVLGILCLTGCSSRGLDPLRYTYTPQTNHSHFTVCHAHGCATRTPTALNDREWAAIKRLFRNVRNADAERKAIIQAVAYIEVYVGRKTGTTKDRPMADLGDAGDTTQMDCVDEAINTSVYLYILENEKLLKFHNVDHPITRGKLINGRWPHNTATIKDKKTGKIYAVDSWFRKNGADPYIVPAKEWINDWHPPAK